MSILLDPYIVPEKGKVELKIDRSFEIKISAEEARRQVNRWLRDEVSMLIRADLPTLVVGRQIVWRTPIWISFPHTGRAGQVGVIEVDVMTGAMNNTLERQAEIERQAEAVAAQQPPYRSKDRTPEQYLAQNVPSAPKLHILEDGSLIPAPPANQEQS